MCGIVGIIAKNQGGFSYPHIDLFSNMLVFDSIRGEDSTGVFGVTKENVIDFMKGNADGYTFTSTKNFTKFKEKMFSKYKVVVGHNRKATKGSVTPDNAHPFQERHITLVHNGTLFNQGELKADVDVDSHAIAHALADADALEALKKLRGAYALVWHDAEKKTINLCRNDERPLTLLEYDDCWVISSEVGLPIWLQSRANRKNITCKSLPSDKILIFDVENLSEGYKEIPYEQYKTYVAPVQSVGTGWGGRSHHYSQPSSPYLQLPDRIVSRGSVTENSERPLGFRFKQNEQILMKIVDTVEEDDKSTTLFGHPIIDNVLDENIMCKASVPVGEMKAEYEAHVNFHARIKHWTFVNNIPVIFVRELVPSYKIRTANDQLFEVEELKTVGMKEGCTACGVVIDKAELPRSLFKKLNTGKWKVLCPLCVNDAIKTASPYQAKGVQIVTS